MLDRRKQDIEAGPRIEDRLPKEVDIDALPAVRKTTEIASEIGSGELFPTQPLVSITVGQLKDAAGTLRPRMGVGAVIGHPFLQRECAIRVQI